MATSGSALELSAVFKLATNGVQLASAVSLSSYMLNCVRLLHEYMAVGFSLIVTYRLRGNARSSPALRVAPRTLTLYMYDRRRIPYRTLPSLGSYQGDVAMPMAIAAAQCRTVRATT